MQSFYWFDFETFGVNPSHDRPAQFAGIRTDEDFEIIDEPLNIFCKPADDFLPHPQACLITGITPQQALQQGLCERDFFRRINQELSTAQTCAVGYNNIRFDDEVVRFGFYRNFFDAYAREWQDGNSRWDILDMLRMTHALRPDGINWPQKEDGSASFRLEQLSIANQIEHANAHDALADVYATIAMAKLVKLKQPRLFQFLLGLRDKNKVRAQIDLIGHTPFVHSSAMLGAQHQYCAVMLPLVAHPINKNSAICLDLTRPSDELSTLNAEQLQQRIFSRQQDLPEGVNRLPIKEVHYNKCPAVAPMGVLDRNSAQRLNIDLDLCQRRASELKPQLPQLKAQLLSAYQSHQFSTESDPDFALYSGGFFGTKDKRNMAEIRKSDWATLAQSTFQFEDPRLPEMLFRYRARNAPESLNSQERQRWDYYRHQALTDPAIESTLKLADFKQVLKNLRQSDNASPAILDALESYASNLMDGLPQS